MNNLHIVLNEFRYASRILKQTSTLSTLNAIDNVFIAALHAPDLKKDEKISKTIFLKRFNLKTRNLNKNLVMQILKYLEFSIKILIFYKKKEIKMINVHSCSLLPLGYLFKLIYGSKLIYDTHELETETHSLKGLRKKLNKLIERLFILRCDHIFVVSENIANWYSKSYNITRPTVLYNASPIHHVKKNDYFRKYFSLLEEQIIFLYQGALSSGRGIEILIETFKNRKDDKAVIVFMGYGKFKNEILTASKLYNNIFFHEAVQNSVLKNYTVSADVGLHLIKNTCLNHNFCMPNKLFEYGMSGLAIISSNVKEMSEFIKTNRIGIVVDDYSSKSLNIAIEKLLNMDFVHLKQNAKKVAFKNSWENQEKKMKVIYKKIIDTHKYSK